jgi:hypothetical protein
MGYIERGFSFCVRYRGIVIIIWCGSVFGVGGTEVKASEKSERQLFVVVLPQRVFHVLSIQICPARSCSTVRSCQTLPANQTR